MQTFSRQWNLKVQTKHEHSSRIWFTQTALFLFLFFSRQLKENLPNYCYRTSGTLGSQGLGFISYLPTVQVSLPHLKKYFVFFNKCVLKSLQVKHICQLCGTWDFFLTSNSAKSIIWLEGHREKWLAFHSYLLRVWQCDSVNGCMRSSVQALCVPIRYKSAI